MNLEKLKQLGTVKRFAKGEFICYEGAVGTEMFIILSGQVAVYGNSFKGVQEKFAVLGTGEFFGEMSMLDNQPRSASGVAESEVIVLSIPKENFQRLIREVPEMAFAIMTTLSRRIRQLEARLLEEYNEGPVKEVKDGPSVETTTVEEPAIKSPDTPFPVSHTQPLSNVSILPEGHKIYGILAPETHKNYYFEKAVSCPVCRGEFVAKNPRMTKLRLDRRENDLREVYVDFEPLWYNIRTCPYCLYSENYNDFDKLKRLTPEGLRPYQEKALKLHGKVSLPPADPLSIDRVFLSYYLALYYTEEEQDNPLNIAKLYMALSWLYQDVGDEELYRRSWNQAFDYYYAAYYGSSKTKLKPEHEQQLCLILGELYLRKGEVDEALKHFYAAIRRLDGTAYYNNLARDRYMEVKEQRK
ncbi:MAG: DUF2225 domain-containing protein [Clostridia bacterium]|nr:DUF2225 domain-containing protein [Clostridia bacterium]